VRIILATRALENVSGGVERMVSVISAEFAIRDCQVSVLSFDNEEANSFYQMDNRVSWLKCGGASPFARAGFVGRIKRLLRIRQLVKGANADVILAFQQGCAYTVSVATLGMGVPLVAAERNAPHRYQFAATNRKYLELLTLIFATKITVQMPEYRDAYPWFLRKKIIYIPNSVSTVTRIPRRFGGDRANKPIRLLSVGRLCYQKNHTCLIKALNTEILRDRDWLLDIVGEGEELDTLKYLIESLNLQGKINLVGSVKDVSFYYRRSDLFCFPSRWEGFPNALAEALAFGLPAIGFEECQGVSQLIEHEFSGYLVKGNEDADAFANGIASMLDIDRPLFARMSEAARQSIEHYSVDSVIPRWLELFRALVSK